MSVEKGADIQDIHVHLKHNKKLNTRKLFGSVCESQHAVMH